MDRSEDFVFNLATAHQYAQLDRSEEWVLAYLNHADWANPGLASHIHHQKPIWTGPVEFDLETLVRICGPEQTPARRFYEEPGIWNARVDAIATALKESSELPPLIVRQVRGKFEIADGNHRLEAMLRKGWTTGWVFLWVDREEKFADSWSRKL